MGIGWSDFIAPVKFMGESGNDIDPFFIVTHLGEPVTHQGEIVTHTIPIPENAVYSGGEPVTHAGSIVTHGG